MRAIENAGGTVTLQRGGHYRITGPGGVYFTSSSPSDHRARKNLICGLRKIGLHVTAAW